MSSLIKTVRRATVAVKSAPSNSFATGCIVNVVADLASRIDRGSGSPSFSSKEHEALTEFLDAWRVAEPAPVADLIPAPFVLHHGTDDSVEFR